MTWSTEQTHQIVEQFWQSGAVRCPDDNGPLKLRLHKLHGGDYDLSAECPVCGKRKELRRGDDPRRRLFRPWTELEIKELTDAAATSRALPCPVCSAPVEWRPAPIRPLLHCFRCGNSDLWQGVSRLD